ncbi:MAG: sulfoxide reductase heme-binding subunit YedZ [Anaerolineaceae bacterium]|nr:sulfoxide reductase heme-binding subunit YedZ [Anaerolineaceae bacterium]
MKIHFTRFQILVHLASLIPFILLVIGYFTNDLTADPIQAITQRTGQTAIRILLISLACTPLNTLFGFRPALTVRRALGLYAFFYATLHFITFTVLDYGLDIPAILRELLEKWYLIVGSLAFFSLIPLAITSTKKWMKWLGAWWRRLHNLVYGIGILTVIHYFLAVKADIRTPFLYGGILLVLLALRLSPVRRFASQRKPAWITPINQFLSK